jgi:UV DNA damage endonuclease
MRISSDLFPFASHETYGYDIAPFVPLLSKVGELADKYGHRLTTHPGQYVQLGSPTERVLEASIRELKYHCEFMEGMGIGKDGVCILHVSCVDLLTTSIGSASKSQGGGTYGDKKTTLERIKTTIRDRLPQNVRDRLVLENDEVNIPLL